MTIGAHAPLTALAAVPPGSAAARTIEGGKRRSGGRHEGETGAGVSGQSQSKCHACDGSFFAAAPLAVNFREQGATNVYRPDDLFPATCLQMMQTSPQKSPVCPGCGVTKLIPTETDD
jgi:hypothetical protein